MSEEPVTPWVPRHTDLDQALDALEDVCQQGSVVTPDGYESSGAISSYARALRLLAYHGRFEIVRERGRVVVGRFIERKE